MLHFVDLEDAQRLCECLAAPARVEIMRNVLSGGTASLDALAKTLHLTNGAITQHVKKLCDAGLIRVVETHGKHGIAKRCVPAVDRIIIDIAADLDSEKSKVFEVPLGSFSAASVKPYCAIATPSGWVGERDDPGYFTYPERKDAALIYFNSGFIAWTLPMPAKKAALESVSVSLEISSKTYGYGRTRDSEISFYLGDVKLGSHTVDGEFTDRKGLFTPGLFDGVCRYGKYKTLAVNKSGTFLDGLKIGAHTISEFEGKQLIFALSTENGVALFGKGYGDYNRGLGVKIEYAE